MRIPSKMLIPLLAAGLISPSLASADDWPQWMGPDREGVWREDGIIDKFPEGGPTVKWRTELAGGYSGPAVADGRVFVMDRQNPPDAEPPKDQDPQKVAPGTPVIERVLCLDSKTGEKIWEHTYPCHYRISYPSGPRCTPTVDGDRVYTLGAMGDLYCLEAATGKVVWSKDFVEDLKAEVPVWGWASHPLISGDRLFCTVGGSGQAVVCFDKNTGEQLWKKLGTSEIGYAPPVMITAGGVDQLIIWLSEKLCGLNPETGEQYWSVPYPENGEPQRPSVNIAQPMFANGRLFVSSFYHGGLMVRLDETKPAAEVMWRGKSKKPDEADTVNLLMSSPVLTDTHLYGAGGFGHLRCLDAETGKQLWDTFEPIDGKSAFLATAFIVPQGDRYFLFNDHGDLIIAKMSPEGYEQIDKAHVIEPSQTARGRTVVWSHPAFAEKCAFLRNDKEIVCVSLAKEE